MARSSRVTCVLFFVWFTLAHITRASQGGKNDYSAEVEAGVKVLRALAVDNQAGAVALRDAIQSGDLEAAKAAYALSRPAYEQIEVLAGSFEDIDSDLDARANAFDNGEAVEGVEDPTERGAHFQGFHRIEALLFRNEDLEAALVFAEDLIKDSDDLTVALSESERFSAGGSFAGMIGLSTEVGAKKMSSEEETYSDLSILIFHNNYLGVESQYRPFASLVRDTNPKLADEADLALAEWLDAVSPLLTKEDGSITYKPYTEVTIPQRKTIQFAAYTVAQVLTRVAEELGIDTSGGDEAETPCETQPAVVFAGDSPEVSAGLDYFRALMPFQKAQVSTLIDAIKCGDLSAAKDAYTKSRPLYEQIEVLAVSFPDEDSDIDARPAGFELGEFDNGFKGFHKIERKIYRDGDLGEETVAAAEELLQTMDALEQRLNTPALFGSVETFEGMIGLATEVPAKKISSEEETFSLLSYLIFYNNYKGIYSQLKPFVDSNGDAKLSSDVDRLFDAAIGCLPVETTDTWNAVAASDVTQEFVDALSDADYKEYKLEHLKIRECIIVNSYLVRDILLKTSRDMSVFSDCHPFHESAVYSYRHSVF